MPAAWLSHRGRPAASAVRSVVPGALLCLMFALASAFVSEHHGGPQLLYALLFGMVFHFVAEHPTLGPGIAFSARHLLRWGVAMLGARISLDQMLTLGWAPVALVCVAVVATIGFGLLCAACWKGREGLPLGMLSGGAVAICGASAAMAIAAALPRTPQNERHALVTVVGVTSLSTMAMIVYPTVASALGLDAHTIGILLGATIHDVAQVVGASLLISPEAADVATLVKLLRVSLLAPVVLVLTVCMARRDRAVPGWRGAGFPLPGFLVAFLVLAAVNSAGWLPAPAVQALGGGSRWLLVTAIAALGVRTSLQELAAVGWRPLALLAAETAFLFGLVLSFLCWRS